MRELLTAPLPNDLEDGADPVEPGPLAFYQANEMKGETVAGAAIRLFLGHRIECAQCHNHPFAAWTQKQFWQTAAFFSDVPEEEPIRPHFVGPQLPRGMRGQVAMPGSGRVVPPRFLDDAVPAEGSRRDLAEWVTAPNNAAFARTGANRVWAQMFGVGLVDPPDDFGEHNPPSHPELLDDLAKAFAAQKYDVRFLQRAIARSQAYQRTSAVRDASQADPRRFARMPVKGLSAEQLFDSLALATGYRDPAPAAHRPLFGQPADSPRGEFLAKFSGGDQRTDVQASILQALTLMNGKVIGRLTDPDKGELLAGVAASPFLDAAGKIETLYLATLSRPPSAAERRRRGQVPRLAERRRSGAVAGVLRRAVRDQPRQGVRGLRQIRAE